MPLKKLSRKQKKYHFQLWLTKGIKVNIDNRDRLHRKWLRTGREDDVKLYKKYRNLLTRIKTIAMDNFHAEDIEKKGR